MRVAIRGALGWGLRASSVWLAIAVAVAGSWATSASARVADDESGAKVETLADVTIREGIRLVSERRESPRPLRIHRLTIDLNAPGLELAVGMADDPDGDGPAETVLSGPLDLGVGIRLLAGVNANAWAMVPDPETGRRPGYIVGKGADVSGWVRVGGGIDRSPPSASNWSIWLDADNRVRVGAVRNDRPPDGARVAVSGFGGLARDGAILPAASEVRHPRTAAGVDAGGRVLTLLVVDGRRPGYSEGVSERELAELMIEFGCRDALNLDGGGSSVLFTVDPEGEGEPGAAPSPLRIRNRPSDPIGPRPVPVVIGVRARVAEPAAVGPGAGAGAGEAPGDRPD